MLVGTGHTGCSEGDHVVCSNEHSIKTDFISRIQLQELQGDPAWTTEPGEGAGPLPAGEDYQQPQTV